ncbi:MAG: malto-oligosyltrehalose trehalohydrolase, partial [Gammaproteobacteria bacterium]
ETVLYELHVGTFSATGDFDGVRRRLAELAELGVTAIELLPVADFPGRWNWGYDGVLQFAPDRSYGTPEDLKRLIDAAHGHGLMVFLDVVYNHFGPDGNYLHVYARDFFTADAQTPWGAAIDFRRTEVREFFIENTLYWLEEYRFDGLRFDAVHAIDERWRRGFLAELAARVRQTITDRHVHLVLENDANEAHWLHENFDAQWNDDIHHAAHVLLTGEASGYYEDYQGDVVAVFGRALAEGFVYQGEPSAHRDGQLRGEPTGGLPPTAFVSFLQNHDQVGNRAFGERIHQLAPLPRLRTVTAMLLLAPQVPMLFMGEESLADTPFLFFCDFGDDLAQAVREGRRREFASFPAFDSAAARERIPDPAAPATLAASRLPASPSAAGREFRDFVARLLAIRRERLVPLLHDAAGGPADYSRWGEHGLAVSWRLAGDARLTLIANLGDAQATPPAPSTGERLFAWPDTPRDAADPMPGWSMAAWLAGPAP